MMFCLLQSCRAARGRPTRGRREPQTGFAFARFPLSQSIFGTARSGQGRAHYARRRRIFSVFEKILRSAPLTARTVPHARSHRERGPSNSLLPQADSLPSASPQPLFRRTVFRIIPIAILLNSVCAARLPFALFCGAIGSGACWCPQSITGAAISVSN